MLVPTFLMGLLFPVAGKICVWGLRDLGRGIGDVYAANTAGAIFGAFAAGFVLIPLLGTQSSVQLLAWTNVAVGATVLLLDSAPRRGRKLTVLVGLLAPTVVLALLVPSNYLVRAFERAQPGAALLYHAEDAGGTVTVHGLRDGTRLLRVNGAGEVPTDIDSMRTFRLLGTLPLLLHPDPEEVLVIAFGGGITLAAAELLAPERIDCVEVVPGVFEASRYFAQYNGSIFERLEGGRLEVLVDDGRNHILRTRSRYDAIISDATHPGTADSWILYTEEFYRLCKKRLKPGGIVAQWLPLHGLTPEDHRMILRTFRTVFPHATLWLTRGYTILLATPDQLRVDLGRLRETLTRDAVRQSLSEVDLGDPVSFLATLALDEVAVAAYVGPGRINTDDRPHVSLADRRRTGTAGGAAVLLGLIPHLTPRVDARLLKAREEDTERLTRRRMARRRVLIADLALRFGDRQRALRNLRVARALDPDEPMAPRFLERLEGTSDQPDPRPAP
jgi:spermidine synthase